MYSSDTADTAPAVRGFVPPQNDDERRLMRRVEELCRICESRAIPRYTGFLSDREQSLAQAACNRAGCSCIRFWGGFDGAGAKSPLHRAARGMAGGAARVSAVYRLRR